MKGTVKLQTDPWAIVAVLMMLKIDPQILVAIKDSNGNGNPATLVIYLKASPE